MACDPDPSHPLSLTVQAADGDRSAAWSGSVTSNEPLPGFVAAFEIDIPDPSLISGDLRMFDITPLFTTEAAAPSRWFLRRAKDPGSIDR